MQKIKMLALAISSATLLMACSTPMKQNDEVKVEERAAAPVSAPAPATSDTRTVSTVDVAASPIDPLDDPKSTLAKRSIYFDYDSYIVKNEFKPVIEAHAAYLSKNTNRKVLIQGNTDERGGREYNLALGQKRAEAVRKSLTTLSVSDAQIEAVSYGKEKPKATGSNEAAWAENRRADIVYQ